MANTGRLPATSAVSSIVPDCATLPRSLRQNTNYQQLPTAGQIPTNNAQIPGGIPISGQFPTSTPAYQAPANTPFMIQTPTAGNGAPTNAVHDVVENDAFSMLPPKAVVLYDFQPQSQQEVAVLLGDIVDCLAVDSDRKWLYVRTLRNTVGYIPSAYCRFMAVATPQPARRANQNQARANLQANRNRSTSSATQFQATTLDRRTTKRTPVLSARFVTSLNDDVICQVNQPAVNRSIPSNYVDSNRLIERNAESRQTDTQNLADNTQNLVLNTQAVSKTQTVPNTQRNTDRADNTLSPCSVMSTSTSSGVRTSYSSNSTNDSIQQEFVAGAFNRAAVEQYGSASGSSTCSSACERRIKMLKEQKVLDRRTQITQLKRCVYALSGNPNESQKSQRLC